MTSIFFKWVGSTTKQYLFEKDIRVEGASDFMRFFVVNLCVLFLESFLELQNEKSQCLKMKNFFYCCIHIPFCKTPGEIKTTTLPGLLDLKYHGTIGCTPNSVPMVFIGLSHRGTLVGVHPTIP